MPETPPDDRAPMAIAAEWSARITTIGLEMALPAAGGFLLDRRIGTLPLFLVLGAMAGFAISIYHIIQIARSLDNKEK
jgi:F0F1-type ATP synthase assembly protein I